MLIQKSKFLLLVLLIFLLLTSQLSEIIARTFNILAITIKKNRSFSLELFGLGLTLPSFSLQQSKTCQDSNYLQMLFKNKKLP